MITVSQIDIELIILINLTIFLIVIENNDAFVKNVEIRTMQIVKIYKNRNLGIFQLKHVIKVNNNDRFNLRSLGLHIYLNNFLNTVYFRFVAIIWNHE